MWLFRRGYTLLVGKVYGYVVSSELRYENVDLQSGILTAKQIFT